MSEWISVKDRLPDVGEDVFVFAKGKIDGFIGDTVMAMTRRFYPHSSTHWSSTWVE